MRLGDPALQIENHFPFIESFSQAIGPRQARLVLSPRASKDNVKKSGGKWHGDRRVLESDSSPSNKSSEVPFRVFFRPSED
jgi:hypothetical protein